MKKNNLILVITVSFLTLFVQCKKKEKVLLSSIGLPGTIIVVNFSEYALKDIDSLVRNELNEAQYGLPQAENQFDFTIIDQKSFSKTFRSFRNIILIQGAQEKNDVLFSENVWATQQFVGFIKIKTSTDLEPLIKKHKKTLLNAFNQREKTRLIERNHQYPNNALNSLFSSKYQSMISIQDGFDKMTDTTNFTFMRLERERDQGGYRHQISQGLWYYTVPYTNIDQLSTPQIIHTRDSLLKLYVHGQKDSSYFETASEFIQPTSVQKSSPLGYCVETRGLWRMKNGVKMGGPFINVLFVDTASNQLHMFDGFVYAPNFKKREYLRELEAVIYSFERKK